MYLVEVLDASGFWQGFSKHETLADCMHTVDKMTGMIRSTRVREENHKTHLIKTTVKRSVSDRAHELANIEFQNSPKWYITCFNKDELVRTDVDHRLENAKRGAYSLAYQFDKVELRDAHGVLLKEYTKCQEEKTAET